MAVPHLLALIGTALLSLAVPLSIIGAATPHWAEFVDSSYSGLFTACGLNNICVTVSATGKYQAVQALVILGDLAAFLSAVIAVAFCVLKLLGLGQQTTWLKLMGLVAPVAGLGGCFLNLVGAIFYAVAIFADINAVVVLCTLGYSFFLTGGACPFMIFGAVLFFVGAKKSD